MAEVLVSYDEPVRDGATAYHARAVGRHASDGMWEGWLEFVPIGTEGQAIITGVESRQPEHTHLVYWATGLTPVYLDGALRRARDPLTVRVRVAETAVSNAPAKPVHTVRVPNSSVGPEPVLDPFEVGGRNIDILKQELRALNRPRLLNIIDAYALNPGREDVSWMSDHQLVHFIAVAVETRLSHPAR